jgi:type IV pilus assembly protein PilC
MAYPAVMMVLAIAVTVFLLTFVMPKFTPLFERQGSQLPKSTKFMMAVSFALMNYWYLWVLGIIGISASYVIGGRTESGRQAIDWTKIHMPLLGPMFRKVTISRSIRTLGTMISSGVPVLEAIALSAEVSGNYYFEKLWREVLDQVTSGNKICAALSRSRLFPKMLVQMISSGEETGKLDVVLGKVSNYYDQEVETSLKTLTSMIEPIMITVMGVIVGSIAMALLLPIFSLSKTPG